MDDEYQRRVTVGQAMNMAHEYILACDDPKKLSFEGYKKLLRERTLEFKAMIESIQDSYANAAKAMPKQDKNKFEV